MFLQRSYSIGVLIVMLTVPLVDSQVMVTSTLTVGRPVCPGDIVNFTCITRGSFNIAWRSEEYVEIGGTLLEFSKFMDINSTKKSPVNPNTVATFINRTEEDGIVVLKSQLRIVASSNFPNSTVVCIHSNGLLDTISFQLLGDPDVPEIEHNPIQREMTGERGTVCFISFGWKPVVNVKHYMVHVDEKHLVNETVNSTAFVVCGCTTRRLRLQAVNMCNRLSDNTTKDVPYSGSNLTSFIESSTGDISTDTSRDSTTNSPICPCPSCDVTCIVLLIFLFILLSVIIVLVVTIVIIIRGKNKVGSCFKGKKISSHSALNIPSNERESELHSSEQKTETDTKNKDLSAHGPS